MINPDVRQALRLAAIQSRRETRRANRRHREVRVFTAYPQGTMARRPQPSVLESRQYATIPRQENYRTYWGRSLDLNRIEQAIRNADCGLMRNMADMGRETLRLDGHAMSCLQKRLNRVAALPYTVEAAGGAGVDKELAEEYRREVEIQLKQIPRLKRKLKQLSWATYDGRAALEIQWHFDPRQNFPWRVRDLHWIHPRRINFGSQRQLQIIDSNREYSDFVDAGVQIDQVPLKFITHTPQLFADYQEREGLCPRLLYWSFFGRFGVRERFILVEIFGKPWRIAYVEDPENAMPNDEDYAAAMEQLDALGGTNTAVLPRGFRADVPSPGQGAGQVHHEAIEHAQLIISKLVLGSTSTTDAQPAGLGSNQSDVHKSEEDLIIEADAEDLADSIEDGLTDAIVVANRGMTEVINAPTFKIAPAKRADPEKELRNARDAVSIGVPVALAEVRERTGYREVAPDEPYLQLVQRPAPMGAPAPPPSPEIVWPAGKAPKQPGELMPSPEPPLEELPGDAASARAPGDDLPEPGADVGLDAGTGDDSLEERRGLAAKMTELGLKHCDHGRSNRCRICGIERVRDVELDQEGNPQWSVEWRAIGDKTGQSAAPPEPTGAGAVPITIAAAWRSQTRRLLASKKNRQTAFHGIPIVVDRPKGTVQKGTDRDGNEWERTYEVDYGYIPRTEGGDGEALDVFLGPDKTSERAYWVRQVIDGEFDEYKLFLGFASSWEVEQVYAAHIPRAMMGDITRTFVDQVKALVGVKHQGKHLSERLNAEGAVECEHGKRRKCLDCGVVKSRQGAPWRMLAFDESKVKREDDGRFGEKPDKEEGKPDGAEDGDGTDGKRYTQSEVHEAARSISEKKNEQAQLAREAKEERRAADKLASQGQRQLNEALRFETSNESLNVGDALNDAEVFAFSRDSIGDVIYEGKPITVRTDAAAIEESWRMAHAYTQLDDSGLGIASDVADTFRGTPVEELRDSIGLSDNEKARFEELVVKANATRSTQAEILNSAISKVNRASSLYVDPDTDPMYQGMADIGLAPEDRERVVDAVMHAGAIRPVKDIRKAQTKLERLFRDEIDRDGDGRTGDAEKQDDKPKD